MPRVAAQSPKSAYTCTVFTFGGPDGIIHPTGINNSGQVVGYVTGPDGVSHGFLRNPDGSIVPIEAPGAVGLGSTQPQAINNVSEIAGLYTIGEDAHGFIRSAGGSYVDVAPPTPPADAGEGASIFDFQVSGLNDSGVIAGTYHVSLASGIDANTYFYSRGPEGTFRVVDRVRSMFNYFFTQSAVLDNSGTVLERAGDTDAVLQPGGPVLFPGLPRYQPRPTYNWTSGLNNNLATAGT
jgi:probable HAF family extracellular repeat protein